MMKQGFELFFRKIKRKNVIQVLLVVLLTSLLMLLALSVNSIKNGEIENHILTDQNKISPKTGKKQLKNGECSLCANLPASYGNSSPKDLIITGVFGGEKKLNMFVKSLRSTGSQARVVVISNTSFAEDFIKDYLACNVEFFIMKSTKKTHSMYPHSLRYVGYQQFFQQTTEKFDRVLHADSFDVFFQKDPFNEEISKDKLYFVLEDIKIENSSWNSGWLIRAYNESVSQSLGENIVSCSGTVIGGYNQFLIYLNTLLEHPPFWANGRHSLDQAYHNFLLHTGVFEKKGINAAYFGCNSHILTMHYCSRHGKEVLKNNRIYTPNGKILPAIVHQYPLFRGSQLAIKAMCS
ncbi:hypothetical protein TRFO_01732 [Tritrichomonas foetus]|uniref:Uncharacterized protein n=1 Tax=Tritrichomonas foetus TaxID=1144522 RepID=A0A1J4JUD9_9EUKA|nr:hypothetical protein TRFO_01732 [Tritrichomonas foetus]|eukprot:OHT01134.1 hypothetical protein TRFO_01732 [Tritrichomonas foetus]